MEPRPRIFHVMADGDLAGGAVYLLRLLPMLEGAYEQWLATSPGWLLAQLAGSPYRTMELPMMRAKWKLGCIRRLEARLREAGPAFVIVHGTRAGWLASHAVGRIRSAAGRPVSIYTNHGLSFGPHKSAAESFVMRRVERYIARRADLVTAVAEHICTTLERLRDAGGGPVLYTPYGLPVSAQPLPGSGAGGLVRVVMAGRLIPAKDPLVFADAAAAVGPRNPAVEFSLVGSGPLESEVRRRAECANLPGRFHVLHGKAEAIIAAADVFVLPSRSEGLSIALLEAMSHGRAVIASDIPPSRDLIEDGVTGLLFRQGDAGELARCLERLCREPALRRSLGQAARERVARDFSEARMAELWQKALEAARRLAVAARKGS